MTINLNAFLRWAVHRWDAQYYFFRCTDSRPQGNIPTGAIVWLSVLGAVMGTGSFLQIDSLARQKSVHRLLGMHKKDNEPAVSDSTLERVLDQFEPDGAREYLDYLYHRAKAGGQVGLVLDGKVYSALGIDASVFANRYAVVAIHMGEIPLLADLLMTTQGKELPTSKDLLSAIDERLGESVDMVVGDALYLNQPHIDFVTETLQKIAVVKYRPHQGAKLPDLLEDTERIIATGWDKGDRIVEQDSFSGTGSRRKHLRYQVWCVRGMNNLGTVRPVDVAKVVVTDTTAPADASPKEVFYVVVAGEIHLSPRAMARIGRLRWQEENEGFRLFNAVCDSKHLYSHKESVTGSNLLLMMIGFNLLRLYHDSCYDQLDRLFPTMKRTLKYFLMLLGSSFVRLVYRLLLPNTS